MAAKARLAIVGGVAAVVAVLAVYALVAGIQGSTNGISVNEEKRGKGTVETLEFKNPVTIRLIDKDGNVASETVVYNAITDDGKAYIYQVLGNSSATVAAINAMKLSTNTNIFTDGNNDTVSTTSDTASPFSCTPSPTNVVCTGTFTFTSGYTPSSDTTLNITSGESISLVNSTTPYFTLNSLGTLNVDDNTTYTSIQITWQITVS